MAHRNQYRVLYFIRGVAPTQEQREDIEQYGPHAAFRNAVYVSEETNGVEPCTAVAGEVPSSYAKVYPVAVSYDDWRAGLLPPPPVSEEDAALAAEPAEGEVSAADWAGAAPGDPFAASEAPRPPAQRRSGKQANWSRNAAS